MRKKSDCLVLHHKCFDFVSLALMPRSFRMEVEYSYDHDEEEDFQALGFNINFYSNDDCLEPVFIVEFFAWDDICGKYYEQLNKDNADFIKEEILDIVCRDIASYLAKDSEDREPFFDFSEEYIDELEEQISFSIALHYKEIEDEIAELEETTSQES